MSFIYSYDYNLLKIDMIGKQSSIRKWHEFYLKLYIKMWAIALSASYIEIAYTIGTKRIMLDFDHLNGGADLALKSPTIH